MKSVNCDWCKCDFTKWIKLFCGKCHYYKGNVVRIAGTNKHIILCLVCFEKFESLLNGELEVMEE